MTRRPPQRARGPRRDDAGFTLPELLISIVILAFITGAIGFSLTIVLRNTGSTADRSVNTLGSRVLASWFTSDVDGALADGGDTTASGSSDCPGGSDPGTNVLTLLPADPQQDAVSYRLLQVSDRPPPEGPEFQLVRVSCPDGVRVVNVVAQGLRSAADVAVDPPALQPPAVDAPGTGTPISVVGLTITVGATSAKVTGTVRTRAANVAGPCRLVNATPQTLGVARDGSLVVDLDVRVAVAGNCGALTLSIDRRTAPPVTAPLAGTGAERTASLGRGSGWARGSYVATVGDGAGFSAPFTVWVTDQPCTVTSGSLARLMYRPLGAAVPYVVTTAGLCTAVSLRLRPGGAGDLVAALTQDDATHWSTTLPTDSAGWTPGRKPVAVLDGGIDIGRLAIDAVPAPCELVSHVESLRPTISQNGKLLQDVRLDVTTTGVCADIRLSVPTGFADPTGTTPLISVDPFLPGRVANGPLLWSFVLPRCADDGENESPCRFQQWTDGVREVTVIDGGEFLDTFDLDVIEPCSQIGNSPQSVTLGADGRLAAPTVFSVTTRGRCRTISLGLPTTSPLYVDLQDNDGVQSVTLQPCSALWTAGPGQRVTIFDNASPLDGWNLNVQAPPPGAVVTGPPLVVVTAATPARVPANTAITIGNVRDCGRTMMVVLPTGSTPGAVTVPLTSSGGTLNGVITPAMATWQADIVNPKTARVLADGVEVGSFLFVVSDCVVSTTAATIDVSGSPNRVGAGEAIEFQAAGTQCGATMSVVVTPPGAAAPLTLTATRSTGTTYRTTDLGGTAWTDGQTASASVHNSATVRDASTLAGTIAVFGR